MRNLHENTGQPPFANQADLFIAGPRVELFCSYFDSENFQRGQRRNGAAQCPGCGLWWPIYEEPDMWELEESTGRNIATGWWGGTICEDCSLLLVDQPDGTCEAYELG